MYTPRDTRIPFVKSLSIVVLAGVLTGCPLIDDDDVNKILFSSDNYAVISTKASDDTSGNISVISIGNGCTGDDEVQIIASQEKYHCVDNRNFSGLSDTLISTHEDSFYRIGRFKQNNITKLQIESRTNEDFLWQFSTLDDGEVDSNPYKIVIKDENTAFIIRYGQSTIWVVNPSINKTENIEEFKIGEIDLSSYTDGDEDISPEASDALLIDNKLYVLIQNLDNNWKPRQAYLAVFDTDNDNTEIKTNDDETTSDGISLIVENPKMMEYLSSNDSIYIAGTGSYFPSNYEGGIEKVQLSDYSTILLVDDGDTEDHSYGQINNVAILNTTLGYFVGSHSWKNDSLYRFNPTTGEVNETPLLENNFLSDIEIGPFGNLWVTNGNESGITIFDTVDDSIEKQLISTDLVPIDIEFITHSED